MSAGRNATTSHSATSGSYNLRISGSIPFTDVNGTSRWFTRGSDIAIRTEKPIVSVDVLIGKKRRRDSHWERTNDQVFQTTFTPSLWAVILPIKPSHVTSESLYQIGICLPHTADLHYVCITAVIWFPPSRGSLKISRSMPKSSVPLQMEKETDEVGYVILK